MVVDVIISFFYLLLLVISYLVDVPTPCDGYCFFYI